MSSLFLFQTDGSRLYKDVKAYYTAVKGTALLLRNIFMTADKSVLYYVNKWLEGKLVFLALISLHCLCSVYEFLILRKEWKTTNSLKMDTRSQVYDMTSDERVALFTHSPAYLLYICMI